MKKTDLRMLLYPAATIILTWALIAKSEDSPKVRVDQIPADQDTSVIIHKGLPLNDPLLQLPDYKIISDTDEIAGDPKGTLADSYASWKTACAEWKKDLKDLNGSGAVLSMTCGRPHVETDKTTLQNTHISTGTYKLKVSIRDPRK